MSRLGNARKQVVDYSCGSRAIVLASQMPHTPSRRESIMADQSESRSGRQSKHPPSEGALARIALYASRAGVAWALVTRPKNSPVTNLVAGMVFALMRH